MTLTPIVVRTDPVSLALGPVVPRARDIHLALSNPAGCESALSEEQRGNLRAAELARLPLQRLRLADEYRCGLVREWCDLTGFRYLGRVTERGVAFGIGQAWCVNLELPSRGLRAGPLVVKVTEADRFAQAIPAALLHLVAECRCLMGSLWVLEPVVKRRFPDGRIEYVSSLASLRQQQPFDPLLCAFLTGDSENLVCLGHWD